MPVPSVADIVDAAFDSYRLLELQASSGAATGCGIGRDSPVPPAKENRSARECGYPVMCRSAESPRMRLRGHAGPLTRKPSRSRLTVYGQAVVS